MNSIGNETSRALDSSSHCHRNGHLLGHMSPRGHHPCSPSRSSVGGWSTM